jgi:tight adherence protein C
MGLLFALLLFLALTSVVSLFGYHHYVKPSRLLDQLTTSTSDAIPVQIFERKPAPQLSLSGLLLSVGSFLPISAQDSALAKEDLISAGFRGSSAVAVYHGTKICMGMVLLLVFSAFRSHLSNPVLRMILPIGSAGAGWVLPGFVLARIVKKRREDIRLSLPDVLDLMVVCSEAGCGLDQAILNVSRDLKHVHPPISEELSLVNMEIMAGKSRADALRNLARRTGEDEMKKLVAILIQTDRFGTGVGEALRTQSDFLRIRRRQDAEERAGKVGVKLVFPIFFFCLPSLLIVTAGPGMLQVFTNLLPMMKSMGH